jgi:hypothetical protein
MATKDLTSADNNVFLNTPHEWENWNTQFQGLAVSLSVWELIEGTEVPLTKPVMPHISSYHRQSALERETRQATATASSTQDSEPQESQSTVQSVGPVAPVITFANLSANNQKAFQFDLNMYQELKKEYNAEITSIRTLKDWIRKTVAPNYQQTCCKPTESIEKWYGNLKHSVQFSNKEIKAELRSKYKLAIKPLTKPKDALNWIMRWEQTMALAQDKKLPVTKDHEEWFDDFMDAVNSVLPNWVPGYRLVKMTDVNENSLSYRTIANDFRQAVRQYLGSTGTPSKVAKGSFGPAYADQNATENAGMDASTEGDIEVREKGKKRDSAANKRKRLHDSSKDSSESFRTVCKACGQRHSHSKCWYLFPSRAPRRFKENPIFRKVVDQALKDDPAFADEVERLKKRKDTSGGNFWDNQD